MKQKMLMALFGLMRKHLTSRGVVDSDLRVLLVVRMVIAGLAGWDRADEGHREDLLSLVHRADTIKGLAAAMLDPGPLYTAGRSR